MDFKSLQRKWYKKLAESGFSDIEFTGPSGHTSSLFRDTSAANKARLYRADKEEYFRRAGLFLHNYDFELFAHRASPKMVHFVWKHWCEGKNMPQIAKLLKGFGVPRVRRLGEKALPPPPVFYIHQLLHNIIYPVFEEWCKSPNGLKALETEDEPSA
jgi:hypothetical protein